MFLEPGHFHAALVLRGPEPALDDRIDVYAENGPELRDFLGLIEAFNRRLDRPTRWQATVHTGGDPLGRLLAERPGDAVVLAGRNDKKIGWMRRLHDAGLPVLADKPWLAGPEGLDDVRHVLSSGPLAMEIMTGRYETTAIVLERLVASPVFGGFRTGEAGEPAIWLSSRHHLAKTVNGAPLIRPTWFLDVRVQGDGIADIPTHLVERAQRLVTAASAGDPTDIELRDARRWPTPVPRALFARVTGAEAFPSALADSVDNGVLAYLGNGALRARIGSVAVELETRWDGEAPAGGGDTHEAVLRGVRVDLRVKQGEHTGFRRRLVLVPRTDARAIERALDHDLATWQADLPGIDRMPAADGIELRIPEALHSGHESHFTLVLREFLACLDRGEPPRTPAAHTLAKYTLLAEAGARARRSSAR